MNGLPPNVQQLKEIFEAQGISAFVGKEWNQEYLSVPITVDERKKRTVSARFGCLEGQPVLTELPCGRYVCVRIPHFYQWWDDLNRFGEVLRQANEIAYSLLRRDAHPDFFVDYVDCDVIFFKMDVLLKENETYDEAVLDVLNQLSVIARAVYSYLEKYADE